MSTAFNIFCFVLIGLSFIAVMILIILVYGVGTVPAVSQVDKVLESSQNSSVELLNKNDNAQLRLISQVDENSYVDLKTGQDGVFAITADLVNIEANVSANNISSKLASSAPQYQPKSTSLTSIASLTTTADELIYTSASDTYATSDFTNTGRTLVNYDSASAVKTGVSLANTDAPTFLAISLYAFPLDIVFYSETQTSGTDGGGSGSSTWNPRTLNTTDFVRDNSSSFSLSSDQFTLQAGSYFVKASSPINGVAQNQMAIVDVTGGNTYAALGLSNYNADSVNLRSMIMHVLQPSSATAYAIHHFTASAVATIGLGAAASISSIDEVYTTVQIQKII